VPKLVDTDGSKRGHEAVAARFSAICLAVFPQ
jgi:hypothetical protein